MTNQEAGKVIALAIWGAVTVASLIITITGISDIQKIVRKSREDRARIKAESEAEIARIRTAAEKTSKRIREGAFSKTGLRGIREDFEFQILIANVENPGGDDDGYPHASPGESPEGAP